MNINPPKRKSAGGYVIATGVALAVTALAGWLTHIIVAISVLASSNTAGVSIGYGLLLFLGVIFPPLGAIHGIGVWFGAW